MTKYANQMVLGSRLPPLVCERCEKQKDAGEFLVLRRDAVGDYYEQTATCRSCRGATTIPWSPRANIRKLMLDSEPVTWREHDERGEPYDPPRPVSELELRLCQDTMTIRPSSRKPRERNRNLAAKRSRSLFDAPPAEPEDYLTEMHAARLLGCSEATVARLARLGRLPFARLNGRARLFRTADLRAFTEAARAAAKEEM